MLLFNNADVELEEENGFVPLHVACANGHKKVAEFLVKAGASISHNSKADITPIQLAAQNGHDEIVDILQKLGAKLGAGMGDDVGQTWGSYFKDMLGKAWARSTIPDVQQHMAAAAAAAATAHGKVESV